MKIQPADKITEMLLKPIVEDLPFKAGDEVLLFVNSMGGTPLIELYIVYRKAFKLLEEMGIKVVRNLIGPYITSLEMAGASITLLKMDEELKKLWDAPVLTPGMRWGI
jgi:dihydroxyacetone kinase-like protein